MDQMSLYFQATTTRVWSRRGQTPTVRVATQRDHVHFYGALDVCSGHESALILPKQSGEMTCHFLDHLQSIYPGRALLILWDRAKWHKGAVVRDYLSQHPHIQTLHFPPGSPQLNPQEHVWELVMLSAAITPARFSGFSAGISSSPGNNLLQIRVD
jgi:transposase